MEEKVDMQAINEYHILYERAKIWEKNSWFGVPCWKLPFDAFVLQELIVRLRPNWIVETGTGLGGSAMFYASICELLGEGRVITVDINMRTDMEQVAKFEWADRIDFLYGGSTNPVLFDKVKNIVGDDSCMVILDSWHTHEHVYKEMQMYSPLVPVGGYMVIEDSHADGNPVPWEWDNKGPMGAINQWLEGNKNWEVDYECEKHLMTFNPKGYLRRVE